MAEQAREAAILFADVSGSTKLYETAGNAVAHAAVESCVNVMRQKTLASSGRVIKTIGDEVNLASRLAAVATKGQIITARETVMLMSPMLKANTRAITTIQVKGKAQEIQVYELLWQQSEDMTTLASHKSVFKPKNTPLRLKIQDTELVLSAERPSLAMGRDQAADLVVKERMASRAHGKIERRLDKFILTDHSANGTFVTIEGDKEIVLRREEFTLRGHGWIAFGQSRTGATDVVEFFCE